MIAKEVPRRNLIELQERISKEPSRGVSLPMSHWPTLVVKRQGVLELQEPPEETHLIRLRTS